MFWSKSRDCREPGGTFWKVRLASGMRCTSWGAQGRVSPERAAPPSATPPAWGSGTPDAPTPEGGRSWTPCSQVVSVRPAARFALGPWPSAQPGSPPHGQRWSRRGYWACCRGRSCGWVPGGPACRRPLPRRGSPGRGWPHPSPVSGSVCGGGKGAGLWGLLSLPRMSPFQGQPLSGTCSLQPGPNFAQPATGKGSHREAQVPDVWGRRWAWGGQAGAGPEQRGWTETPSGSQAGTTLLPLLHLFPVTGAKHQGCHRTRRPHKPCSTERETEAGGGVSDEGQNGAEEKAEKLRSQGPPHC